MKTIFQYIGAVVLVLWLLGVINVLDFYLCVGPLDTCTPPIPALMAPRSTTV